MLALAFGALVLGSLVVSALLFLEVLPASPGVLALIGGAHLMLAWAFFRAYGAYHALHRLVTDGQGELFELAVTQRITAARSPWFKAHYRLRRCQGLVASERPREALRALEALRAGARLRPEDRLTALAVEVEANLQLGQRWWAERALEAAQAAPEAARHAEVQAVAARVATERAPAEAAQALAALSGARAFPLTRVVRARNILWQGDALARAGRPSEAMAAWRKAAKLAPASAYGQRAARAAAGFSRA